MKISSESKKMFRVATIAIALAMTASITYGLQDMIMNNVSAQEDTGSSSAQLQTSNVTGDLTQPAGGNPYGGEKIGDINITSDGHQTDITGLINASPAEGNVYEAWLGDAGGSEYRLSLGQLNENGTVSFSQYMVNPFTYTVFFITEEPENDVDPNSADPVGGVELEDPFGQ